MQPGLHGSERFTRPLGDGLQGQVGEVAQNDDSPLVRTQVGEGGLERLSLVKGGRRIRTRHVHIGLHRYQSDAPPPPQAVPADIDDDPLEPRPEAVGIAKVVESLPGSRSGILDRVLGLHLAAQEHGRQAVRRSELSIRQSSEDRRPPRIALRQCRFLRRRCPYLDHVRPDERDIAMVQILVVARANRNAEATSVGLDAGATSPARGWHAEVSSRAAKVLEALAQVLDRAEADPQRVADDQRQEEPRGPVGDRVRACR